MFNEKITKLYLLIGCIHTMKYLAMKRVTYSVSIFNNTGKSQNSHAELKKSGKKVRASWELNRVVVDIYIGEK